MDGYGTFAKRVFESKLVNDIVNQLGQVINDRGYKITKEKYDKEEHTHIYGKNGKLKNFTH